MRRELKLDRKRRLDIGKGFLARLVTEMETENCGMRAEIGNSLCNAGAVALGVGRCAVPGGAAVGKNKSDAEFMTFIEQGDELFLALGVGGIMRRDGQGHSASRPIGNVGKRDVINSLGPPETHRKYLIHSDTPFVYRASRE